MVPHIETEDDIPLLDNAAAASLLSPTLWLNGSRPRTQRRAPAEHDLDQHHGANGGGQGQLEGDDDAKEAAEMEQLREDLQRLSALEDMYTKLKLQNSILERQLMGIYSAVNGVLEENRCMKRLISLLQVRRGDFVAAAAAVQQQQQQAALAAAQQEQQFLQHVGQRLLANLHQPAAEQPAAVGLVGAQPAAPVHPLQQQQQQQQQQPLGAVAAGMAAGPGQLEDGGAHGGLEEGDIMAPVPGTPKVKATSAALAPDSPRIPAYHGAQQQHPAFIPADLPEEAQIAAAVLATTAGDASAALVTLLDRALLAKQQAAAARSDGAGSSRE